MSVKSRVNNSIKNMASGLFSQLISVILSFVVRTVFIKYLSEDYLGINGLFTNILTVLSLAELGFGTAMVYSMYKPLAENDVEKLKSLMKLYKKVYLWIGIVVAICGISIIPFMDYLIKDKPDVDNLTLIYLMFLVNSVFSYFYAYKRSILSADQKQYVISQYRYIFIVIKSVFQISILIILNDFIIYLGIQIVMTLLENIFLSQKVDRLYPFLKEKNIEKLPTGEMKKIVEDVKALMISKFGSVILNGTDNIIISKYVGVAAVGLLSNYTLITGALVMVLSQVSSAITGSIGNYVAKENKDSQYKLFKTVDFCMFWIYGFATICLIVLLNPFIELWIGKKYILNESTIIVLSVNFLISGIMTSLWTFRSTMGLFVQGKYRAIIVAGLNIVVSIVLAKELGIVGVLLGTTISRVLVNLWYDPYIIFREGFNKDVKSYYISYILRSILIAVVCGIVYLFKYFIFRNGINEIRFIGLMFVVSIIPNIIFILIYYNRPEFKYIKNILNNIVVKLKLKNKINSADNNV